MARHPNNAPSERTRLRRMYERGAYDRDSINTILDTVPLCHVAYLLDGAPCVMPTLQWREGDRIYWHGSAAARMLRRAIDQPVSIAVTAMDGLVLARSAFHHSVNYRSVVLFGTAALVAAEAAEAHLQQMVDGLFPGRWEMLRPVTAQELKATTVLSMPIDEASAKVRTGMPVDDEEDYALPIWAGVIPIHQQVGQAAPDPRNLDDVTVPDHVTQFRLNGQS